MVRRAAPNFNGKTDILNQEVYDRWDDLLWMTRERLLFNEDQLNEAEYFRTLKQPRIHDLVRNFRPGFMKVQVGSQSAWHVLPDKIVDNPETAVRLIVFKELYFVKRDPQQKLTLEFLKSEDLVQDNGEFYDFTQRMKEAGYIDIDKPNHSVSETDDRVLLRPGRVFRYQDMYIELLALDYFSILRHATANGRRSERKRLRSSAQAFVPAPDRHKVATVATDDKESEEPAGC